MERASERKSRWEAVGTILTSRVTHATLLFFTGLVLVIREAFTTGPERPSLYVLYAAMMGLAGFALQRPGKE